MVDRTEIDEEWIVVCDACGRASCWAGEFMCDESENAGTVTKPVRYLLSQRKEHCDHINRAPRVALDRVFAGLGKTGGP